MMTPNDTLDELTNLIDLLIRSELSLFANQAVVRRFRNSGVRRITCVSGRFPNAAVRENDDETVAEYRRRLRFSDYAVVLFDGSIMQVSYDFQDGSLIEHRLVYFPCPFPIPRDLIEQLPLSELIDHYADRGVDDIRLRSPLRFDFKMDEHAPAHPSSHFTFQWSYCRIPVKSPLSLGHFIKFVFKNFYPESWSRHQFIREWREHELPSTISDVESKTLHLDYQP